jgi:arylsulfatase A-like enzyme
MKRREFLKTAGVAATMLTAAGAKGAEPAGPPNILFVFSDQQRWDSVDCYGAPIFKGLTPNLDKMASDGVRFINSFTCQPVCGPARAALQTGKYASQTTCHTNGISLPRTEKTLAHLLSAAGYDVGYLGKWHLASDTKKTPGVTPFNCRSKPVPTERQGGYKDFWLASDVLEFTSHAYDGYMFDGSGRRRAFPKDRYRVDAQTDWAIEFLQSRKGKAKPFFLFVSYIEPHHQNDHRHFEGPRGSKEKFKDYKLPGDLAGTKGEWRKEMPDYLGCCGALDKNVGRLRGELKRLGLDDNTVVIYTTDHACHFRTRNSEYKRSCHDNSIRTPLIACGPGFTGGKVIDDMVSLIDVPPTLLKAGRAKLPDYFQGRPLQTLADGSAKDWPEEIFVQISESHTGRAIRTKKWKYSVRSKGRRNASGGSDTYIEDFLYDLQADPHERKNLIADPKHAATRAKLAVTLKRRMSAAGEKSPSIKTS